MTELKDKPGGLRLVNAGTSCHDLMTVSSVFTDVYEWAPIRTMQSKGAEPEVHQDALCTARHEGISSVPLHVSFKPSLVEKGGYSELKYSLLTLVQLCNLLWTVRCVRVRSYASLMQT